MVGKKVFEGRFVLVYSLFHGSLEVVFFSSQLVDLVFHLGLHLALLLRLQPLLLPIQLHLLELVLKTAALDRQFLLVLLTLVNRPDQLSDLPLMLLAYLIQRLVFLFNYL